MKPTPAYDIEVSLDALGLLDDMVAALNETGFDVFSFDAEGGDGQYEFDFQHRSALEMADKVTLFRLAAKQIAKQHGLAATFMPKPYAEAWGSGAHYNMSLAGIDDGANLFRDPDDARGRGWSKTAYGFVAGILRHAAALSAICAPTVNSYKRLTERLADGTNSWAPVWATYGDNNRSCLLRLPRNRPVCREPRRRLRRQPVSHRRVPGRRRARGSARAAGSRRSGGGPDLRLVADARPRASACRARCWRRSTRSRPIRWSRASFRRSSSTEYVAMKRAEWDEFHGQVTEWERTKYFDMF